MKKINLILVIIGLTMLSCENSKKDITLKNDEKVVTNFNNNENLKLFKKNCYACHSVVSKSHNDIIAPPMAAVKRRYLMAYTTKTEFIEAFTNWVLNPTNEDALMQGAVAKFNVMPKQHFNKADIDKISTYIFENDIEVPVWYVSHFNNENPHGMGNRNRKGRRGGKF